MRIIFLNLISFYQKFISPHKGYSCAYGVLHQNGSCSSRVYSIIKTSEQQSIIPEISAQFIACKDAHFALSFEKNKKKNKKDDTEGNICAAAECSGWICFGIFS